MKIFIETEYEIMDISIFEFYKRYWFYNTFFVIISFWFNFEYKYEEKARLKLI